MLTTHNSTLLLKSKTVLLTIVKCVLEIKVWMNANMLKLNDDKTDLIVLKSKHNVNTFAKQNV